MERLTHFQEDVLADILQSIHLHSTLFCQATMGAPWGLSMPRREVASFHIVTGGTCWLTVEGGDEPVLLSESDLVILPHGHAHTMTDDPNTPVTRLEDLIPTRTGEKEGVFSGGGEGSVTTLVCGGLQLEEYTTTPLYSILPTLLHLSSQQGQAMPWLREIVELVRVEASGNRPAAETVITRLSEILFIQAVRAHISTVNDEDGNAGWLGALKDSQIGQALALIHRQPDESWTVECLAGRVNLSRSAFSAKFRQLVGEPPMQYLTRVRLTKATALLRTHSKTLVEVALSVGYDSEVSFSKAFKRYFGVAPGAYRQGRRSTMGYKGAG